MRPAPTQKCIFCDSGKPTKEHVYGKWLRDFVPASDSPTLHRTSYMGLVGAEEGAFLGHRPRLNRNGPPYAVQLKIACKACNNGWMGKLQELGGKKYLPSLIAGEWSELSFDAVTALASWATMVTMTFEFADEYTIAISQSERDQFRRTGVPPETFQVYFGLYGGSEHGPATTFHRAGQFQIDGISIGKIQTTTCHLGRCFFHVLSGPFSALPDSTQFAELIGMRKFWPKPDSLPTSPNVRLDPETWWIHTRYFAELGESGNSLLPHSGLDLIRTIKL